MQECKHVFTPATMEIRISTNTICGILKLYIEVLNYSTDERRCGGGSDGGDVDGGDVEP